MNNQNSPIYIIPQDHPAIQTYQAVFEQLAMQHTNTLSMTVHEDTVKGGDVAMIQELLLALQHYPHLIEKMILAIDLHFTEIEDSDVYLPTSYWKSEAIYHQWFHKMLNLPIVIFFLHDEDARFYCLAGDFLAAKAVQIGEMDRGGRSEITFTQEQATILSNRLYNACWLMLLYCHASGFNPQSYIEAMIASFDFRFTYQDVYEKYKKDVEAGIELMAAPQK